MRTAHILGRVFSDRARLHFTNVKGRVLLFSALVALTLQIGLPGIGVSVAASSPQFYVIAPGDTLSGIADRFGISVSTLAQMNGLASPDYLQVGQKLTLGDTPASPASTSPLQSTSSASQQTHVVVPGETLIGIAQEHGVSVDDLASLNGLGNQNYIVPGQVLTIPNSTSSNSSSTSGSADTGNQEQQSWLTVPYRTQFDGTQYEDGNCGPAALGMMMAYYGQWWSTDELRRSVNKSTGYWGLDGGSDWESLVYAAKVHGFSAKGLYGGPKKYRKWTIDELVQEVQQGRPVMLLVRYRSLPGHESQGWAGDHYIVFLGLNSNGDVIYHDSAFRGTSQGAYRTMSKDRLLRAWGNTSVGIAYSAMSLEWLGR